MEATMFTRWGTALHLHDLCGSPVLETGLRAMGARLARLNGITWTTIKVRVSFPSRSDRHGGKVSYSPFLRPRAFELLELPGKDWVQR